MKVSEAKLKTCPFIQHMVLAVGADNHLMNQYSDINIYCKTKDCMAWEYNTIRYDINQEPKEEDKDGFCLRLMK